MFFISCNICALKLWVQKHGGGWGSVQTLPLGSYSHPCTFTVLHQESGFSQEGICGCDRVLGVNPDLQICFFFSKYDSHIVEPPSVTSSMPKTELP